MTTTIPAVIKYIIESELNERNQNQKHTGPVLPTADYNGVTWLNTPTHSSKPKANNYHSEQLHAAEGIFPIN